MTTSTPGHSVASLKRLFPYYILFLEAWQIGKKVYIKNNSEKFDKTILKVNNSLSLLITSGFFFHSK